MMFGFGHKKTCFAAPVKGTVIDITAVPDDVFSKKMMGDGFAVIPEDGTIVAPADAKVLLVADTKHAIALETDHIQYLIHAGLDTVELQGHGFTPHVSQDDKVWAGQVLLTFDMDYIQSQHKDPIVVVVLTNLDELYKEVTKDLTNRQSIVTIS